MNGATHSISPGAALVRIFYWIALLYLLGFIFVTLDVFYNTGVLPIPFFRDVHNTFMDFFHVNWWAHHEGFYSEFRSIYSPVNIVIGKILSDVQLSNGAFELRHDEFRTLLLFQAVVWGLSCYYTYRLLAGTRDRVVWTALLNLSFPMLFAIERGNYIILTLLLFLVYMHKYSNGSRISLLSPLFALVVMSKLHAGIFLVSDFIKKRWSYIATFFFWLLFFFITSGFIAGVNDWYRLPINILGFLSGGGNQDIFQLFAPTASISGLADRLGLAYSLSESGLFFIKFIEICLYVSVFGIYYALVIRFQKEGVNEWVFKLATFLVATLLVPSLGYYAIIMAYPIILYLLKNNLLSSYQRILCILIVLPYPILISGPLATLNLEPAFRSSGAVSVDIGLTLNSLAPTFFCLLFVLSVSIRALQLDKPIDFILRDFFHNGVLYMSDNRNSWARSPVVWIVVGFISISLILYQIRYGLREFSAGFNSRQDVLETRIYLKGLIHNPEVFYQSSLVKERNGDYAGAILDMRFAIGLLVGNDCNSKFIDRYEARLKSLINTCSNHEKPCQGVIPGMRENPGNPTKVY